MSNINRYLHTSVSDAKISLEQHDLPSDPKGTAATALALLEQLRGNDDQVSRRKMLAGVLRKAAKALAASEELDATGTAAGDYYAEMPTTELRDWIERQVAKEPAKAALAMVDTLAGLRGEYGTTSRRKMLAAGVGKAAKALVEGGGHDQ